MELDVGIESRPVGVWWTGSRFLIAAVERTGGRHHLRLWESTDGQRWDAVPVKGATFPPAVRAQMAVGDLGYVLTVDAAEGPDVVLTSPNGTTWSRSPISLDWVPAELTGRPGGGYVKPVLDLRAVAVSSHRAVIAGTRDVTLNLEQALFDSFPDVFLSGRDTYELLAIEPNVEEGTLRVSGVRHAVEDADSLCSPYAAIDYASRTVLETTFEEAGLDPDLYTSVLRFHSRPAVWVSDDLRRWSADDVVLPGNRLPVLSDVTAGGAFAGILGTRAVAALSGDGIAWKMFHLAIPGRYTDPRSLTWWGERLAVLGGASSPSGDDLADLVDEPVVWTGVPGDLRHTALGSANPFQLSGMSGSVDEITAGPGGLAVVGTEFDTGTSTHIWLSAEGVDWEHTSFPAATTAGNPSSAVGTTATVLVLHAPPRRDRTGAFHGYMAVASLRR